MSNKLHESDETSPQNEQEEEVVHRNAVGLDEKTMKIIVVVLGILLLIGFAVVVITIVYRVVNLSSDESPIPVEQQATSYEIIQTDNNVAIGNIEVSKPLNSKLIDFQVDDGLIYFNFEMQNGEQTIKIVRLSDGLVMGAVDFVDTQ